MGRKKFIFWFFAKRAILLLLDLKINSWTVIEKKNQLTYFNYLEKNHRLLDPKDTLDTI